MNSADLQSSTLRSKTEDSVYCYYSIRLLSSRVNWNYLNDLARPDKQTPDPTCYFANHS